MPLFVRSVTTLDWTGSAFKLGSMCFVKAVLLFSWQTLLFTFDSRLRHKHTPNANMADHSVSARDELHESEASEASEFCFDNASFEKSCFVEGLVCFISLCLLVFEFLNATRREWNLPLERKSFSQFSGSWGKDRRSKGVHDRRANCKSLFATFQARIS